MIGPFRALLQRSLARAASDRILILAGGICLLALLIGATPVVFRLATGGEDALDLSASVRASAWTNDFGLFGFVLLLASVTMGANLVAGDIKARTLFAVLARPVPRWQVFLAGWTSAALIIVCLECVRSGFLLVTATVLERRVDPMHVLGVAGVMSEELLFLALFAAAGAVLPPAYAALCGIAALAAGDLAFTDAIEGFGRTGLAVLGAVLPLHSHQEKVVFAALAGSSTEAWPVAEIVAYRLAWTALLVAIGCWLFARRDLAPRI